MARQALVILLVVIAFGILVPIYKGFGFLDPRILAAYACLALLFVAPASAELAAARLQCGLLGRIAIIVAWGWGDHGADSRHGHRDAECHDPPRRVHRAPVGIPRGHSCFQPERSIAVAMLGAVLARRFSAAQVKTILRTAFLVILLTLAFGSRFLPENVTLAILDRFNTRRALTHLAWESSAVCGAITALLLLCY